MKQFLTLILIAIVFTACTKDNTIGPLGVNNTPDQYIVVVTQSSGIASNGSFDCERASKAILASHNIDYTNVIALYDKVLAGFCVTLTPPQVAALQKDSRVMQIEKDQPVSINGFLEYTNPKQVNILAQTIPWGITSVGGSVNATTSTGVAWILDTGVDLDHPDLTVNTALSKTFVKTGKDAKSADDLNGHGSHVAGIIAAKNNTVGVIGVCAGATVIPVKVLNSQGSGSMSQIISGLNYVASKKVANKVNVVNLSLGGSAYTLLDNAVTNLANQGVFICIAAGNDYANSNNYSPARVNGTNIYTVSAHDANNAFAYFSNWANPPVDVCAPGVSIYSCYKNGRYATMSGTSMATPHVVGIILARNGSVGTSGTVTGDPDGISDPKAIR